MAPPRRSAEQMQWAINLLAETNGNASAAARNADMPVATFQKIVDDAKHQGYISNLPKPKPRIRVPARMVYEPQPLVFGKAVRVLTWGCAHDSPGIPDKSRFKHVGRLAQQLRPDFIVDLGDTLDLDSLSTHAASGSVDDRQRPGFLTEIDSLEEAIDTFDVNAPPAHEVPRYHLNGNHEYRARRFELNNPTTDQVYTLPLAQVFARHGFSEMGFREWLYIEGVGFSHAPINMMGKEYGGKTAGNMVLNEATHSIVWSHIHRQHFERRAKIGIGNGLQSYNTGTFLPQGYLKQYAGLSQTGWTYGASELTLRDGQIESARFWSELELRERFA
jgi:hypothetical protein